MFAVGKLARNNDGCEGVREVPVHVETSTCRSPVATDLDKTLATMPELMLELRVNIMYNC